MHKPDSSTLNHESLVPMLLNAWELKGYRMGLDKHLQIRALLKKLPDDIPLERMKTLLAPLFASESQQQQEFYDLYDTQLELLHAANAEHQLYVEKVLKWNAARKIIKKARPFLPIVLALAVIGVMVAVILDQKKAEAPSPKPHPALNQAKGNIIVINFGHPLYAVKRLSPVPDNIKLINEFFKNNTLYIQYDLLKKNNAGKLVYRIWASPRDSFLYALNMPPAIVQKNNGNIPKDGKPIKYAKADEEELLVLFDLDTLNLMSDSATQAALLGEYTKGISTHWQFGVGKAYFTVWKGLLLLLAAVLVWLIGAWINYARQRFTIKHSYQNDAPYNWHLSIPRLAGISLSDNIQQLLKEFRKRSRAETERLDMKKTIRKTAENAGMVHFEYSADQRTKEYLILLDKSAPENHRTKLFEVIVATLREWEAPIVQYYFDGDMRWCWNDKHERGISLKNLHHKYSNHCLIVFGTNESLLSPSTYALPPWAELILDWKKKVMLTPKPIADWDEREAVLAQYFTILPATPKGFGELMETIEAVEPKNYLLWKRTENEAHEPVFLPKKLTPEVLWLILQVEFTTYKNGKEDDRLLRWIIGCALPPVLFWEWTLYLGEMLTDRGEKFLNTDNLFALNRLAWFVNGSIPENARKILIKLGEDKYPVWFDRVKYEWEQILLLNENIPPIGSMAWQNHRVQVLLAQLLNKPLRGSRRQLETELNELLAEEGTADVLALHYAEKQGNTLENPLTARLRKLVYKKQGMFWKLRHWVWQVPVVLSTLLALLLVHYGELIVAFPFKEHISAMSFSADSKSFSLASGLGAIGVCKVDGTWVRGKQKGTGKVLSMQYSADGSRVATGDENGYFSIWDSTGRGILTHKMTDDSLLRTAIAFSPNLDTALVGYYNGQVAVWDIQKKRFIHKFKAHSNTILDLSYPYGSNYFMTTSADSTAKLWTMNGDSLQTYSAKKGEVHTADISPDGKMVITGDKAGMLHIWDLSGNLIRSIAAHKDKVSNTKFSPDGKQILTTCAGNFENTAKLWSLDGEFIRKFEGHADEIRVCDFAPDHSAIATGDASGKIIIWQLEKKQ